MKTDETKQHAINPDDDSKNDAMTNCKGIANTSSCKEGVGEGKEEKEGGTKESNQMKCSAKSRSQIITKTATKEQQSAAGESLAPQQSTTIEQKGSGMNQSGSHSLTTNNNLIKCSATITKKNFSSNLAKGDESSMNGETKKGNQKQSKSDTHSWDKASAIEKQKVSLHTI